METGSITQVVEMKRPMVIRIETPTGSFRLRMDREGIVSLSTDGQLVIEPRAANSVHIRQDI